MQDLYLLCLVLGAGVLIVQTVLGVFGADGGDGIGDAGALDGLDLLSVRSVAAASTLFGALGLWLAGRGLSPVITLPVALLGGAAAAVSTAFLTRQLLRLESDGTIRVDNALGRSGTVYLPIPARGGGHGLVHFTIQGRTVELRAVSEETAEIPTGSAVIAVAVMAGDIVEVTPTPLIEGIDP